MAHCCHWWSVPLPWLAWNSAALALIQKRRNGSWRPIGMLIYAVRTPCYPHGKTIALSNPNIVRIFSNHLIISVEDCRYSLHQKLWWLFMVPTCIWIFYWAIKSVLDLERHDVMRHWTENRESRLQLKTWRTLKTFLAVSFARFVVLHAYVRSET
jgi:hypothetical protein